MALDYRIASPQYYFPEFPSDAYRPHQAKTISEVLEWLDSDQKYLILEAPTGSGKSLIAAIVARASLSKTVYLTATKQLQAQLVKSFPIDVFQGKGNYHCGEHNCSAGNVSGCNSKDEYGDYECQTRKFFDCNYYNAMDAARASNFSTGNYHIWELRREWPGIDLLVIDECDSILSRLTEVGVIRLHREQWNGNLDDLPALLEETSRQLARLEAEVKFSGNPIPPELLKELNATYSLAGKLHAWSAFHSEVEFITREDGEEWFELVPVTLDPWFRYFADADKVLLMSATPSPKLLELVGVKNAPFISVPSLFPIDNCPIYRTSSAVSTFYKARQKDPSLWDQWVEAIDEVIDAELHSEYGILVYVRSNANKKYFLDHTRHWRNCTYYDTKNRNEVLKDFGKHYHRKILVGTGVERGIDLPGDSCRTVIVGVLPRSYNLSDLLVAARIETMPAYSEVLDAADFDQLIGRGIRSEEDWCKVFIVDKDTFWFRRNMGHLAEATKEKLRNMKTVQRRRTSE